MRNKKSVLAIVVAVIMTFSMVAVLAACSGTGTFNIKWENYLEDISDYAKELKTSLPTISKVAISSSADIYTGELYDGLVTLYENGYDYGYSIVANRTFAQTDHLSSLYANTYRYVTYYYGYSYYNGYKEYLYDIYGDKIVSSEDLMVNGVRSVTEDGETTQYLELTLDGSSTVYYKVLENGGISTRQLSALPTPANGSSTLPQLGDTISADRQSLGDWLNIDYGEETDSYLTDTEVELMGRNVVFYNGDKKLSTWLQPLDLWNVIYVDGSLIYTTRTPMDPMATKGYNYVYNGSKYNVKTYSLNIKNGRSAQIAADYVIAAGASMYNMTDKTHDLALITAIRMVDGVAWAGQSSYSDQMIINAKGKIGFSMQDSEYGLPMAKFGTNYITYSINSINIVTPKGKIVASLSQSNSELLNITSNSMVLNMNGKIGAIDSNGMVTASFKYNLEGNIYGNLAVVSDDNGQQYVLNLTTGAANPLGDNVIAYGDGYLLREYDTNTHTYSWKDLNGRTIVSGCPYSNISLTNIYMGENHYVWARVEVESDWWYTTYEYIRIAF